MSEDETGREIIEADRIRFQAVDADVFELNGNDIAVYIMDSSVEDAEENIRRLIGRSAEGSPLPHQNMVETSIPGYDYTVILNVPLEFTWEDDIEPIQEAIISGLGGGGRH